MDQDNWRWCNKCQGLAFAGNRSPGSCPAGGAHDHAGSGNYHLLKDTSIPIPFSQDNWRWCNKCQGLAFAGNASPGPCPAGAQHDHGQSGNYILFKDVPIPVPSGQENWRWCNKCQGLAFAGSASPGACPAGAQHDHGGSGNYVLIQR
jgi:rubrerythrin